MHILGKVLVWFSLLGVVPAVLLSVKMLDTQNSWTKKVAGLKKQNVEKAKILEEKAAKEKKLRDELAIASMGAGRFWRQLGGANSQPVNVAISNRQSGELTANIGSNHGITQFKAKDANGVEADINPTLHAFRPDGSGFIYVGAFQVQSIRESQIAMLPMWKLQPGETQQWGAGGAGWHFRTDIPISYQTRFDNLHADTEFTLREMISGQANLAQQQEALTDANQKLAEWQGQLIGPETPPAEPSLPPEFKIGLVPAMEAEEESRNKELAELDRLRHLLKDTNDLLQSLNRENSQNAGQPTSSGQPAVSSR